MTALLLLVATLALGFVLLIIVMAEYMRSWEEQAQEMRMDLLRRRRALDERKQEGAEHVFEKAVESVAEEELESWRVPTPSATFVASNGAMLSNTAKCLIKMRENAQLHEQSKLPPYKSGEMIEIKEREMTKNLPGQAGLEGLYMDGKITYGDYMRAIDSLIKAAVHGR